MDSQQTREKIQKLAAKRKSGKVIKFLDSKDEAVVIEAIKAMGQIGDEDSVNTLAKLLDSENAVVRKEAARALGEHGTEYTKTYLQHRLSKESDETVKTEIMAALKAISDKRK